MNTVIFEKVKQILVDNLNVICFSSFKNKNILV